MPIVYEKLKALKIPDVEHSYGAKDCMLYALGLGLGYDPVSHPDWLLEKFDQGNRGEPVVLSQLSAIEHEGLKFSVVSGLELEQYGKMVGGQIEVEVPVGEGIVIRAHLDGIGKVYSKTIGNPWELRQKVMIEVKTVAPSYAEKLEQELTMMYAVQISVCMAATGLPGLLVFGLKDEQGEVERVKIVKLFDEPPVPLWKVKARVAKVEGAVNRGELVDCDYVQFPCPFHYFGCEVTNV
jgi:hypothetical protein